MLTFLLSLPVFASLIFALTLVILVFRKLPAKGRSSLIAFGISLAISSFSLLLAFFLEFSPYIYNLQGLLVGLTLAFILSALTFLLVFFLEYTRRVNWLTPFNALMLGFYPTLTFCLLWLGPVPWSYQVLNGVIYPTGPWMWAVSIYGQLFAFFSVLIFVRIYQGINPVRRQLSLIVVGYFCLIVVQQSSHLEIFPIHAYLALYLGTLAALGLIIAYIFLYQGLLERVPILREAVVEKMPDGWTIVNHQNRILDLNAVAESVVGAREGLIGEDVNTIFTNWDNVVKGSTGEEDVQLRASTSAADQPKRFFNLTAVPLTGLVGEKIGWLVLWRDITQRRAREQIRQRAQNEMFGLLYSISSAASRTETLENFININLQDILHVFKCRLGAVFLADMEKTRASSELFLAAHFGLSVAAQNKMYVISAKHPLVAEVIRTREPLVLSLSGTDLRLPEIMRQLPAGLLLILPMLSDDQLIGVLGLARDANQPFSEEEIGNLSMAAEQVANYVNGDRRRQLAVVLAERQKLVRDLHDSVTQKLYGLVALTEAAKAGLELGSSETMVQVLPRIGENARQAIKEMRLFLYGLQPVNIERDGLTSVLHQRLAAVEGRADIKARFISEDNISLPIEKQVALYFIAQEALNNVLKHAKAASVTIHLGQTRSSIVLEIVDDGCGTNPSQLKGGGMGIKNMQVRAAEVGGKLKIDSSPGKGTRVRVTLPKDSNEKDLE